MGSCMAIYTPSVPAEAAAISAAEAARRLNRAGVEFVELRPPRSTRATSGFVPNARLISLAEIAAGTLPPAFDDRSLHIIVVCRTGRLAARAARRFAELGFARASHVVGGTGAWTAAGLPTAR